MVALRERQARPSYSTLPDGLNNLSNSDSGGEGSPKASSLNSSGPSGSRPHKRARVGHDSALRSVSPTGRGQGWHEHDSDSEVSSGGASDFAPSVGERKGKVKRTAVTGGPKGKSRQSSARAADESGSEDEYGYGQANEELRELSVFDADEDDDKDDGMGEDEEDDLGPKARGRSAAKGKGRAKGVDRHATLQAVIGRPTGSSDSTPGSGKASRSGPLAAPPGYVVSDINLVPPAYRALIKASAQEMVKSQSQPRNNTWSGATLRSGRIEPESIPAGSTLPFVIKLDQHPDAGSAFRIEEKGDKEERRKEAVRLAKKSTLAVAWQAWEGEGWYPEMYAGPSEGGAREKKKSAKGKGKEEEIPPSPGMQPPMPEGLEGWTLRAQVRLGLDDVGRMSMDALNFVPEE
jgi:hypothetical protein